MGDSAVSKDVSKSIVLYGILYLILYILSLVLWFVIHTHIRYYAPVMISGAYVAARFAKDNGRIMTYVEKKKFIYGAFICTVVINAFFTGNVVDALRSVDELNVWFIIRQLIYIVSLLLIFSSDKFLKKSS